jgi:hypothetical protein
MFAGLVSDAQLEREHDPASSSASAATQPTDSERQVLRSRILGGRSFSRFAWYDGTRCLCPITLILDPYHVDPFSHGLSTLYSFREP